MVKSKEHLMEAVNYVQNIKGIKGILVIKDGKMAVWVDVEIMPLNRR